MTNQNPIEVERLIAWYKEKTERHLAGLDELLIQINDPNFGINRGPTGQLLIKERNLGMVEALQRMYKHELNEIKHGVWQNVIEGNKPYSHRISGLID